MKDNHRGAIQKINGRKQDAASGLYSILHPVGSVRRLTGVLVAYVDESGTHDKRGREPGSKVAGLAGYVASEKEWVAFSKRWNRLLTRYGVRVFHLSDFENGKPPYDQWSEAQAESFIDALTGAIRKIRGYGLGMMVDSRAYNAAAVEWKRRYRGRFDHTYYFVLVPFLEALLTGLPKRMPRREQLALVFDRQQQFRAGALRMCDSMRLLRYDGFRLGTVAFSPKDSFPPLQAADCLVHWMRRDVEDHIYGGTAGGRIYFLVPRHRVISTWVNDAAAMCRYTADLEQRWLADA